MQNESTRVSEDQETSPQQELVSRLQQQGLIAQFGHFALKTPNLDAILTEASRVAAEGLATPYAKVLEWKPQENVLLLRAGVGWKPGLVGRARVGADLNSPAGFALKTGEPVISNHLLDEKRFRTPKLMADHQVRRAVNVIIRGDGEPYGVLEVDSRDPGAFSADDVNFLQALANLLGVAIEKEASNREIERLNAALAESNAHYRRAVELSPQVPWTASPDGKVLDFNERWLAITGLTREEALGDGWIQAPHPEDREALEQAWLRSLRTGEPFFGEARVRTAAGDYRWMRSCASAWRDEDGRIKLWYGTVEDIHDRRLALINLRKSEEQRRLALEVGQLGMWDHDLTVEPQQISWDDHTYAIFGFPPGEQLELPAILAIIHPDDQPAVTANLQQALDPEVAALYDQVVRIRRKTDGAERWLSARGRALFDGEGEKRRAVRLLGTVQDVTDRRAAEQQTRENEAFLRSLVDASTDCIKVVELDGSLSYMNFNGICAMEIDDFRAVSGKQWAALWPAEAAREVEAGIAAARESRPTRFEAFCPTAKGTPKWWDVSVAPIPGVDGLPARLVSISRDVTVRVKAEQALKGALTDKDLLIREVDHRVKNSLAMVGGLLGMQKRAVASEEAKTALGEAAARLMTIARIHERLYLGRDLAMVEAAEYLTSLCQDIARSLGRTDAKLDVTADPMQLPTDRAVNLGLIAAELVTNAFKHAHRDDGVTVITVRLLSEGERFALEVSDNGPGLPADFDLSKTTGLGMKVVQTLARSLDGSLTASKVKGGACFALTGHIGAHAIAA